MKLENDLRRAVRGRVLMAGDEGFGAARRAWNLAVHQPARAVVEAADADDVSTLVSYARRAGLSILTQPSGHGAKSGVDGAILLRTKHLSNVDVFPGQRVARVGAGALWGEVLAAAGPHDLIALAGSSPAPSVTGYTLGGGLSWFGRKFGFAANSVRSFEVVDAEGDRSRVTADSDADLFWALRGGGGDFALVTAMEFDLYPAPSLFGGRMLWPASRAAEVLGGFREVVADAPDELSIWYDRFDYPDLPVLPHYLRGLSVVAIYSTFLGAQDEARALLSRFDRIDGRIMDTRCLMPVSELGGIIDEPTRPGPGVFRAELLTNFDDIVAEPLLAEPLAPLLSTQVRHLGGAFSRPVSDGGACGQLSEPFLLRMSGIPITPDIGAAISARQTGLAYVLRHHVSGRKPFNYLGNDENVSAAFSLDDLTRLRSLKGERDPDGVFRSNYPVFKEVLGR